MKVNQKLILVFTMVVIFLTMMVSCVNATGGLDIIEIPEDGQQQQPDQGTSNDKQDSTTGTVDTTDKKEETTTPTVDTTDKKDESTTKLPQTGIEDNTLLLVAFIGIFAVSAIYAYRKVIDFKNV